MFSGIIDHCGEVLEITQQENSQHLKIETQFKSLQLGESVAVDGVCLTVTAINPHFFECDLSSETLALTHLNQLKVTQLVNLERALCLGDHLGGHFVSGHVDQAAFIKSITQHEDYRELEIAGIKPEFKPYLVPKGSVALNGVSLTLNKITPDGFKVMLIPHSLESTNLKQLNPKSPVNIEFDLLTKTVFNQLKHLKEL